VARSWRRRLVFGTAAAAGVCLVAALTLAVVAAKERDDRFCVSCHLHQEKYDRFSAAAATDLAGFHHQRDRQVACISCHGGADMGMRARVWALAALDTAKYLVGVHEEPTRMRIQLRDVECRQCHTPILKTVGAGGPAASSAPAGGAAAPPTRAIDPSDESTFSAASTGEGAAATSYHILRDHDGVRVRCVRCHTSHTTGSDAKDRFISRVMVQPLCRECHKQM
jgi:predicted CXXCH cytochrome family protein